MNQHIIELQQSIEGRWYERFSIECLKQFVTALPMILLQIPDGHSLGILGETRTGECVVITMSSGNRYRYDYTEQKFVEEFAFYGPFIAILGIHDNLLELISDCLEGMNEN